MKTILFTLFSLFMVLDCQSAEQIKYLDDLKIADFKSGWGKTKKNKNISGNPLSIDGKVYKRGIGTHAEFYGRVRLNKTASRFKAVVGVDDGAAGQVEFQIKLDGKFAWKSGTLNQGDRGKKVDLALDAAEMMELIVTDGGNEITSDHANWCDAQIIYSGDAPSTVLNNKWQWVTPKKAPKNAEAIQTKYLDSMKLSGFKSGWKETKKSTSIAGNPLSIGGKVYQRGVGTHAEFYGRISLDRQAYRFQATVGVDDASSGQVEFQVKLDGQVAWASGIVKKGNAGKKVDLKLSGVELMELIVTDGGNGIGSDHANWGDAKISYLGKAPSTMLFNEWQWITPKEELAKAKAALIPYPVKAQWGKGFLRSKRLTIVPSKSQQNQNAVKALERFGKSNQIPVTVGGNANVSIRIRAIEESPSKEAYRLNISKKGISIEANGEAGLFYGVQTLRQLAIVKSGNVAVPYCSIVDYPAFRIRGFMHDVGRNFISMDELKKQIDMMALYKLNVFHFHPTENEGYRVESKKYPKLNSPEAMTRWKGKFYTADELKDLVAFCKERGVMVLPELDMPGHSSYFNKVFGFGMQSDDGVRVLKELVDEWVEIFDAPMFHLGTDEVKLTRPTFVAEMTEYIRAKGKKTLSWHHGLQPFDGETIHQLWNAPRDKNPIIDSRGYVNVDDPITQARIYFFTQYCGVPRGDSQSLGAILCYWPDEPVVNEDVEMRIAPVYPSIAAFGERIWQGNPNEWPTGRKEFGYDGDTPINGGRHQAFTEFEKRLITHREKFFKPYRPEHFPYVQNAQIQWRVIGPFPNNGDANAVFAPEKEIKDSYSFDNESFAWQRTWGGTVNMKDLFSEGSDKTTHTGYALTYVYSPKAMEVKAWINFSRKYLAWPQRRNPKQGHWASEGCRLWINDKVTQPPTWEKPEHYKAPVTEESYIYRKPQTIALKKGWNKVMFKSTNLFTPWTVSFLPIEWDGKGFSEVPGLRFSDSVKEK